MHLEYLVNKFINESNTFLNYFIFINTNLTSVQILTRTTHTPLLQKFKPKDKK